MAQGRSRPKEFVRFVGLKLKEEEFVELRLLASLRGVSRSEVLRRGLQREVGAAVAGDNQEPVA